MRIAQGLTYSSARSRMVAALPAKFLPWPFGMPTSVAPRVVVFGASPGNSPARSGLPVGLDGDGTYEPPTEGWPHPGFYYEDASHYWAKIRSLCTAVARCESPTASEDECLMRSGHFNLGTGLAGTASVRAIDAALVPWLSGLLGSVVPVKVVIGVGVNAILRHPDVGEMWNGATGGLRLDWARPQTLYPFQKYRFRIWRARRADGSSVLVCLWPNHPSRHPFAGPPNAAWQAAVETFSNIVREDSGRAPLSS